MSAVSGVTGNSRMSNLPELGRMRLMIVGNEIYKNSRSFNL